MAASGSLNQSCSKYLWLASPDTGATVVQRSFGGREDSRRMIERLPPISRPSIERAAAKLPRHAGGRILTHAGHVWTLLQIAEQKREEQKRRYSREARKADLEKLRARGAANFH